MGNKKIIASKVYCLLTAKGGNELKDKNILSLLGQPVISYPARAGKKAKGIEKYYVSSECEKILSVAEELGYTRIKRPIELAQANSQHVDVIKHAMDYFERNNGVPDILIVILGNNITIQDKWIEDCVDIMKNNMEISAVVPVYKDLDHNPYRAKRISEDGFLVSFVADTPNNASTNRQDLPGSYFLAHNFWVLNVKKLYAKEEGDGPWRFMGKTVKPYLIPMSIDIHNEFDLEIASRWLEING